MLRRRGLGPEREAEECDPLSHNQPGLAAFCAASVAGRSTMVRESRRRLQRVGDQVDPETIQALASPRCASVNGFSLHANTAIHAAERSTPQGGVVSPMLSNILLTPFDREMRRKGYRRTRYADDWVNTCRSGPEARAALDTAARILKELGVN